MPTPEKTTPDSPQRGQETKPAAEKDPALSPKRGLSSPSPKDKTDMEGDSVVIIKLPLSGKQFATTEFTGRWTGQTVRSAVNLLLKGYRNRRHKLILQANKENV